MYFDNEIKTLLFWDILYPNEWDTTKAFAILVVQGNGNFILPFKTDGMKYCYKRWQALIVV